MLVFLILTYTMPIDSPLMEHIEYLQLRGLVDIPSLRPYDTEWVIGQIDDILVREIELSPVDRKVISYFSPLTTKSESFSYLFHLIGEYQTEPIFYHGSFDERFGGSLTRNMSYSHAMRIRRANILDPFGPSPWNDFQAYLTEGLIGFSNEKIRFDIGRRNLLFGPGDKHSLLLSPDAQGYDGFLLQIPAQYLEFYGMFSILDAPQPKFLSLHRIGINLKGFLKFGFTEAIVAADSLEPLYLNIFLPFYLAQWGRNRDDNIMWSLDLQLHLFNSIFYVEMLIDDYMYEDDPYPDKLAYQVGLKSLLWKSLVAKINYSSVDKWVYTHDETQNVYDRDGRCLGFPPGNDVDEATFELRFMSRHGVFPYVSVDWLRKGEGSIYLPYEEEGGPINPPFPSGVVDKTLKIKVGVDYTLMRNFYFMMDVGKLYRYNRDHVAGNDNDEFVVNLGFWALL
jgi:hypothetical protein